MLVLPALIRGNDEGAPSTLAPSRLPSGDQIGATACSRGIPVIWRSPLPSALMDQISYFPLRVEENAIRFPSGDQLASRSP